MVTIIEITGHDAGLGGHDAGIAGHDQPEYPTGLFLDLYINNAVVRTATICRDRVKLIRDAYLGFVGDLEFMDTQGLQDPDYTGLGARYQLVYLEQADLS